jgi:D-galactose 1-dehydrogenase
MGKRKIAIIGVGKIAVDQHIPVIEASEDFELAATVSTRGVAHKNLPVFRTAAELYAAMPEVGIVSICTPPGVRHGYVREALDAGKDDGKAAHHDHFRTRRSHRPCQATGPGALPDLAQPV